MRVDLQWHASVTSTMDLAAQAAEAGAAEGLAIGADEQTAGRGRRGRSWSSPAGAGLYLSFVLRPALDPAGGVRLLSLITLAAGVAVHDAITRATGLRTELKWPNDVGVGRRKVAGLLAEGIAIGTADQAVVLGVGVNVLRASYPREIEDRATSLETELGRPIDRTTLLDDLLAAVPARYGQLRDGDADGILRAWRAAAPRASGATVEWGEGRKGVTAGIDESGALLVKTSTGVERIVAGELRWV